MLVHECAQRAYHNECGMLELCAHEVLQVQGARNVLDELCVQYERKLHREMVQHEQHVHVEVVVLVVIEVVIIVVIK